MNAQPTACGWYAPKLSPSAYRSPVLVFIFLVTPKPFLVYFNIAVTLFCGPVINTNTYHAHTRGLSQDCQRSGLESCGYEWRNLGIGQMRRRWKGLVGLYFSCCLIDGVYVCLGLSIGVRARRTTPSATQLERRASHPRAREFILALENCTLLRARFKFSTSNMCTIAQQRHGRRFLLGHCRPCQRRNDYGKLSLLASAGCV